MHTVTKITHYKNMIDPVRNDAAYLSIYNAQKAAQRIVDEYDVLTHTAPKAAANRKVTVELNGEVYKPYKGKQNGRD